MVEAGYLRFKKERPDINQVLEAKINLAKSKL